MNKYEFGTSIIVVQNIWENMCNIITPVKKIFKHTNKKNSFGEEACKELIDLDVNITAIGKIFNIEPENISKETDVKHIFCVDDFSLTFADLEKEKIDYPLEVSKGDPTYHPLDYLATSINIYILMSNKIIKINILYYDECEPTIIQKVEIEVINLVEEENKK